MPDEISRLTSEVARDPASRSSIELAEALRRARQLAAARDAARRALARHPYDAEAHDVHARIAADMGDDATALDEWEMAVRLDPRSLTAILGLAFLAYRAGDPAAAARRIAQGRALAPGDPRVAAAERMVGGVRTVPSPASAAATTEGSPLLDASEGTARGRSEPGGEGGAPTSRTLFGSIRDAGASAVLLIDRDGLVVAGDAGGKDGVDHAHATEDLAAELSGLGAEASRALGQLSLGDWEGLTVECEALTLSISPAMDENLVVLATPQDTPLGMARVLLSRARRRAERWLEAL